MLCQGMVRLVRVMLGQVELNYSNLIMDLAFEVRLFEVHHPWPKSCFSQQKNAFERSLSSKKEHYLQCGLSNIIHDEVEMLHRGRQMKAVGLPNYSRGYQKLTIGRRLRHKCLLISKAIFFFGSIRFWIISKHVCVFFQIIRENPRQVLGLLQTGSMTAQQHLSASYYEGHYNRLKWICSIRTPSAYIHNIIFTGKNITTIAQFKHLFKQQCSI